MTRLFESVPNFSEGRDAAKVEAIVAAARSVPGVAVLDVELNADHHRSVVSLAGEGDALVEALVGMIRKATATIDLTTHHGEHPRMGATDVVPFVPLGEATMADAVALAGRLAERVWTELHVPVYLYAEAARDPARRDLAYVRKGEFEGIRDSIATDPARRPDVGDPVIHPTAGAVAIGARPVLIAYNAYLSTPDVAIAKRIAHTARARDGGLAEVKALGFEIRERNRAQVSMNLTDYRKTPIHRALELVRREAERYGVHVEESEIVGLVPEDALLDAAEFYLQLNRFDRQTVLERKVRASTGGATAGSSSLADSSLARFSDELAARTPTPGGGSAAAAAAAFGASLGEMVAAYSRSGENAGALEPLAKELADARREFLLGVDADAAAYEGLRAARKALKAAPADATLTGAYANAVQRAVDVPLSTARLARATGDRIRATRSKLKSALSSDVTTALALLDAAVVGALANVTINLPDLEAAGREVSAIRAETDRLARPSP